MKTVLIISVLLGILAVLGIMIALHPLGALYGIGMYPVPAGTSPFYQLLSGFVPAVAVVSLAGNVVTLWRLNTCAAKWCIRPVMKNVNGKGWCALHWENEKPERLERDILEDILTELRYRP